MSGMNWTNATSSLSTPLKSTSAALGRGDHVVKFGLSAEHARFRQLCTYGVKVKYDLLDG